MSEVAKNLGAFVVTYQRSDTVLASLRVLAKQTVRPAVVMVIDNASDIALEAAIEGGIVDGLQIEYVDAGANLGPAGGAALGLRALTGRGYEYIYWGDDDDPPLYLNTLELLLQGFNRLPEAFSFSAVGQAWKWKTGQYLRLKDEDLHGDVAVDVVGGGQQWLIRAQAISDVGLPDAAYFWGLEDIEYALRARQMGYQLYAVGELMYKHRRHAGRLGEVSAPARKTSSVRRYYTLRNYIHMMCRVQRRPHLALARSMLEMARELIALIRGRPHCFTACFKASVDGFSANLGFRSPP